MQAIHEVRNVKGIDNLAIENFSFLLSILMKPLDSQQPDLDELITLPKKFTNIMFDCFSNS